MAKSKLLKSAFVMAAMIMASRILGLLRDIVSAKTFGLGWNWDAFLYAFMIPNFFRRIVGEGALSSAFIPVYNDIRAKQGEAEAFKYSNLVFSFMGVVLIVFILAVEGILAVLLRVGILPDVIHLAVSLLQILFPHLWFLCAYAIGMGILNSHGRFFVPMLGPVLMNVIWIVTLIWIFPFVRGGSEAQLHVLAWALTLAGFLHWVIEWPFLQKIGFRFKWVWEWPHEGLLRSWKLFMPVLVSFGAVQVNMLVDTAFAYWIGPGANSSLWYGNRVMQLPLAMFGVAMGSALLPMLSTQIANQQNDEAKQTLAFSLTVTFMIVIPSAAGLLALAPEIMRLLFERGEFDAVSTARTASVLMAYSWGLFAYSGQKMMITGYYAAHDSKTPMRIGVFSLGLNIVLNFILMSFFKETGLALSTSICAIIQFLLLMAFYPRCVGSFPFRETTASFLKTTLASALMAGAAWAGFRSWTHFSSMASTGGLATQVFGVIFAAALFYILISFVIQKKEATLLLEYFKRKRQKIKT